MQETLNFTLKPTTIENLHAYAEILHKDISSLLEEALESYFAEVQKALLEKNLSDENAMTNLDYDEFWDGVDLG
jgi:tRNA A37 N6-isopentenylltransferase MiaA